MNHFVACRILGVEPGASLDEIKKAYRLLAKQYHPDQNTDPEAAANFIQIKKAYDYLIEQLSSQEGHNLHKKHESNHNETHYSKNETTDNMANNTNIFGFYTFIKESFLTPISKIKTTINKFKKDFRRFLPYFGLAFLLSVIMLSLLKTPAIVNFSEIVIIFLHKVDSTILIVLTSLLYILHTLFHLRGFNFVKLFLANIIVLIVFYTIKAFVLDFFRLMGLY